MPLAAHKVRLTRASCQRRNCIQDDRVRRTTDVGPVGGPRCSPDRAAVRIVLGAPGVALQLVRVEDRAAVLPISMHLGDLGTTIIVVGRLKAAAEVGRLRLCSHGAPATPKDWRRERHRDVGGLAAGLPIPEPAYQDDKERVDHREDQHGHNQ